MSIFLVRSMTYPIDTSVEALRERLHVGEYSVDPAAIADAIVRRRWSVAITPTRRARVEPRSSPASPPLTLAGAGGPVRLV